MQIGFPGILLIVFIVLKLTNVIAWSWVWVLAPIWISFLVWIAVILVMIWASTSTNYKLNVKKKKE